MKFKLLLILILNNYLFAQNLDKDAQFQIGIYALQSPTGSKGHQTGSLNEIKNDINVVNGTVNASIPYRHWDRVNYPNWNFTEYFLNYLSDMYLTTFDSQSLKCIQSFTPPLYSSFLDPPLEKMPDNDRWYNRNLDFDLFSNFIKSILKKELELIKIVSKDNKNRLIEILMNKNLRPLGGWYLDDEPFVRNHDIEIIETMSELIRLLENDFFYETISKLEIENLELENYFHPRYIAFDGDDLHRYPKSSRSYDGRFYNYNGRTIYFEKDKIYSVFKENTFDVLLLDFYHNDIKFWSKIINDIKIEFNSSSIKMPKIMPVVYASFDKELNFEIKLAEIETLLKVFNDFNLTGIWFYIWDDFDKNKVNARELFLQKKQKIKDILKLIN